MFDLWSREGPGDGLRQAVCWRLSTRPLTLSVNALHSPKGCNHDFFKQAVFQGEISQRLLQVTAFTAQRLRLVTGRLAGGITGKTLLARFEEFLRQLQYRLSAIPSRRHIAAMLSSPRKPSSTMRIFSSND